MLIEGALSPLLILASNHGYWNNDDDVLFLCGVKWNWLDTMFYWLNEFAAAFLFCVFSPRWQNSGTNTLHFLFVCFFFLFSIMYMLFIMRKEERERDASYKTNDQKKQHMKINGFTDHFVLHGRSKLLQVYKQKSKKVIRWLITKRGAGILKIYYVCVTMAKSINDG